MLFVHAHACIPVVMARFARDCLNRLHQLTHELEVQLGPDTTDLNIRIGLHSGPVTAGVLRGEKARFQLFGDTVNTTSRIESTGLPGRIHMSKETADLIIAAGKKQWAIPREDSIIAKGKGKLQTYWLDCKSNAAMSHVSSSSEQSGNTYGSTSDLSVDGKRNRLVDWNVEVLVIAGNRGPPRGQGVVAH